MNHELLKNRRKTRETLLAVIYAAEMTETDTDFYIQNCHDFLNWLDETTSETLEEILREQLDVIFEDIRYKRYESDVEIGFILPRLGIEKSFSFAKMDEENHRDGFQSLAKDLLKYYPVKNEKHSDEHEDKLPEISDKESTYLANYEFFLSYLAKYKERNLEVDDLIKSKVLNWDFSRVTAIDRIIIRMGVVELKYFTDIPPKVTINEAIELGKKFSTTKSNSFINGILNSIMEQ